MEQLSPTDALREAISRVGSQSAMGRLVGVTQAAVWGWLKLNKPLPAEHVLLVERETGIPKEV
ncbi:transcriptional regulator, partial [Pseudomonas sp. EA_15y_Pfl1_P102]